MDLGFSQTVCLGANMKIPQDLLIAAGLLVISMPVSTLIIVIAQHVYKNSGYRRRFQESALAHTLNDLVAPYALLTKLGSADARAMEMKIERRHDELCSQTLTPLAAVSQQEHWRLRRSAGGAWQTLTHAAQ